MKGSAQGICIAALDIRRAEHDIAKRDDRPDSQVRRSEYLRRIDSTAREFQDLVVGRCLRRGINEKEFHIIIVRARPLTADQSNCRFSFCSSNQEHHFAKQVGVSKEPVVRQVVSCWTSLPWQSQHNEGPGCQE